MWCLFVCFIIECAPLDNPDKMPRQQFPHLWNRTRAPPLQGSCEEHAVSIDSILAPIHFHPCSSQRGIAWRAPFILLPLPLVENTFETLRFVLQIIRNLGQRTPSICSSNIMVEIRSSQTKQSRLCGSSFNHCRPHWASGKPADSKAETPAGTGEGKCMWAAAKCPDFRPWNTIVSPRKGPLLHVCESSKFFPLLWKLPTTLVGFFFLGCRLLFKMAVGTFGSYWPEKDSQPEMPLGFHLAVYALVGVWEIRGVYTPSYYSFLYPNPLARCLT